MPAPVPPALVRTGMSDVGVDPEDVAEAALSAVDDGTFSVVPTGWGAAVMDRGRRLAAGDQPIVPTMTTNGP